MISLVEEEPQNASTQNGVVWTGDEIRILVREWKQGIGFKKIGKMIGRSRKSVAVKASRIGLTVRSGPNDSESVNSRKDGKIRNCLSCAAMFYSTGNGNRMCIKCKNSQSWQSGSDCAVFD